MIFEVPQTLYTSDFLASLALLVSLLLVRVIAGRALRNRADLTQQVARRWTANIRNVLILIAVVGLIMIWAPQLRTFALSLTAVAVALVVATKELLLCLSGAALRTFTRAFTVGDIVEIGSTRGEVLDLSLLAAHLRELEPGEGSMVPTGRSVIVPYSLLFGAPAKVFAHSGTAVPHRFTMTFEPHVNVFALRTDIERTMETALVDIGASVRRPRNDANRKNASQHPDFQLNFQTSDIGKYRIEATVMVSADTAQEAESAIICAVGAFLHEFNAAQGRSAASAPEAFP